MGIFSRFENRMEDTVEGAASRVSKAPITPVQIAKKAEKQMRRETMVGAGKEYAPTLYTVLVNPDDDARLFGYYPTLAGETETYLKAKASQEGLVMDGNPLVRFIVDEGLRHGKVEVIAEAVAAPIVEQLREEEMQRYGLAQNPQRARGQQQQQRAGRPRQTAGAPQGGYASQGGYAQMEAYDIRELNKDFDTYDDQGAYDDYDDYDDYGAAEQQYDQQRKPPLPYVPEDEIDRSIDYGEYTFNSEDFEDYRDSSGNKDSAPLAYNDAAAAAAASAAAAKQRMQQPNTVAFTAGGGADANQTLDHHNVRARLINLKNQRPYDLAGTTITLGRESSNNIPVQDINASRRHAQLSLNQQGLWVITDMNSMNGTLVNGISVASQPLYPGDVITIGKTDFEFTLV